MTIEEKDLLADSMDMFAHGNDDLNRTTTQDIAPESAKVEPTPVQTDADRTRDDKGRFASQEATPPTPAPAVQTPAVNTDADPEKQPISRAEFKGYLDEKQKRQKLDDENKALRAQVQEYERQHPTQLPSDPVEIQRVIESARTSAVFEFSEEVARKEFGNETVQAAMDWGLQRAQQNPAFQAEYLRQKHPIDWAVKQFKRDKILSELGDDPDAFIEQRVAARLAALNTAPAALTQTQAPPATAVPPQPASQTPATPAPTRSIANATSAGGVQVVPPSGEFAAIDGMFNR